MFWGTQYPYKKGNRTPRQRNQYISNTRTGRPGEDTCKNTRMQNLNVAPNNRKIIQNKPLKHTQLCYGIYPLPTQKEVKENKPQHTENNKTAGPKHSKEQTQQKCTHCFVSRTRKNTKKSTGKTANNRNKYSSCKSTDRLNLKCPKGHLHHKTTQSGHLSLPTAFANGAKNFQPFQFF